MGELGHLQPRKLHNSLLYMKRIQPNLRFTLFTVFVVSKGNVLDFYFMYIERASKKGLD